MRREDSKRTHGHSQTDAAETAAIRARLRADGGGKQRDSSESADPRVARGDPAQPNSDLVAHCRISRHIGSDTVRRHGQRRSAGRPPHKIGGSHQIHYQQESIGQRVMQGSRPRNRIKTTKQNENMKKMQPEIQRIEKKYKNRTDNESLMAKSQETMMLYKKYNINPVSSCLLAFIQLPLFFAFLEAINRVPAIFEGSFLGMNLGMTPGTGIAQGNYIYIILIILIIGTTFLSFNNSMKQTGDGSNEMAQQMKMMSLFMIFTISIASFSLPTAIALYWIVTNGFAVIQNLVIKKIIETRV